MKPNDLYAEITKKIIELMETHGSDWTRPWVSHGNGMHKNIITNAHYRGINVLLLGLAGYGTRVLGTFKQWRMKGGKVRKGEKGTLGVFYKPLTVGENDEERSIPILKHFYLFNVDQVDGVKVETPEPVPEPERISSVERFVTNTSAIIQQGGSRACYSPRSDMIRIPEISAFGEAESYYSTLLHELSHWTGHWTRLDRKDAMQSRFGDQSYALEELVAELSAAFLGISLGVHHEPRPDHAKYLNNWMQVLKDDMRAFSTAASKAQQAADYLLELQMQSEAA